MGLFNSQPPWYVAGLSFECAGCGNCCSGPEEGYVWVTDAEVEAIVAHLGLTEPECRRRYVRQVGRRFSLREVPGCNDCVFLTAPSPQGRTCRIYPVRPLQCRTWPFWPSNLVTPEDWAWAARRCPGINRGPLFPFRHIEEKRNASGE